MRYAGNSTPKEAFERLLSEAREYAENHSKSYHSAATHNNACFPDKDLHEPAEVA
jgi:hypothetical protein